jgi:hypothetical protein
MEGLMIGIAECGVGNVLCSLEGKTVGFNREDRNIGIIQTL